MAGRGLNKVILIGNLGRDPEQRRTGSGSLVVNLSVATTSSYRNSETQEFVERTEWHRVVIFGRLAETAAQYLQKGSKVYIEGKLQTRKWEDPRTGADRYTTEIIGREVIFLDQRQMSEGQGAGMSSREGSASRPSNQYTHSSSKSSKTNPDNQFSDDPIEDIPW